METYVRLLYNEVKYFKLDAVKKVENEVLFD